MIDVKEFYNELLKNNIDFFTGVPDSLLKEICAYIALKTPKNKNIITSNEGGAISLATGYQIATKKIPMIYMQNSGIGNAVNPLMSLADKEVYSIPMLLLIGWRGEPGTKDEPQHIKQGRITQEMLNSMEIPVFILDQFSDYQKVIKNSVENAVRLSCPVAILVRKGSFSEFKIDSGKDRFNVSREEALEEIIKYIPQNSIIVSTTGMLSRELFELREKYNQSHKTDFLTVGSMGHTSQIALGMALAKPDKNVFCFDGDGSAIMHLGNYAIAGNIGLSNFKIILFNNGAHDSVGGQPTIGHNVDFNRIVEGLNFKSFGSIKDKNEIKKLIPEFIKNDSCSFVEIKIKKGARKDLGRPTLSPIQNKELLISYISE